MSELTPPDDLNNICPLFSGGSKDDFAWLDCIESKCTFWSSNKCVFYLLGDQINNVSNIINHIHIQHYHARNHVPADISLTPGMQMNKPGATATPLIVEYSSNEDMDSNGYIYGKDFMINPNDPEIPRMIASIKVPGFIGPFITWEEYLNSDSPFSINI